MEMGHECSQEHTVAHHPALRRLLNCTHVRPAREVAEVETNRILEVSCMSPPHAATGRFRRTVSVHRSRFLPIRGSGSQRRTGGSVSEGAANIHVVEFEKVCRLERSGDAHFEESDRGVCTAAMVVKPGQDCNWQEQLQVRGAKTKFGSTQWEQANQLKIKMHWF